jgi:II/X family phage/plasmid replication protein
MGDYELKTLDINYSYGLPTRADVLAFIRALTFKAKTRHGKPSTKGGTLYFAKTHNAWQLNFIVKRKELKQRQGA